MKKQPTIKNLLNKDQKRSKKKKIIFSTLLVFMLLPIVGMSFAAAGFAIWANGVNLDKSLLPTASAKPVFYDINGEKIDEPYVNFEEGTAMIGSTREVYPLTVGDGEMFVMGDNRLNSQDSRCIGFVDTRRIAGKVLLRFYPFNKFGTVS